MEIFTAALMLLVPLYAWGVATKQSTVKENKKSYEFEDRD